MDWDTFLLFSIVSGGLSIVCFYLGFRFLKRYRLIEDTPTSRIQSAHQGYIELEGEGKMMAGTPIVAPLTKQPCLWYSYKIEKRQSGSSGSGQSNKWRVIDSGISDNLFLLDDGTGLCVVDPERAEITPSASDSWYGNSQYPMQAPTKKGFFSSITTGGDYRYSEKRIEPGDFLYILGQFKTVGGLRDGYSPDEDVRALLREWKQKKDILLARFDADGNGEIDVHEWDKVVEAARKSVSRQNLARPASEDMHTLVSPPDRSHPYIISTQSQTSIARRFRWYTYGGLAGFLLFGSILVWLLNNKPPV